MTPIILKNRAALSYYEGFLESFAVLLDRDAQRIAWDKENGSDYINFEEVYMVFIEPCEAILQWQLLSEEQQRKLQKLYDMLEDYESPLTDKEVYNNPKWHEILDFAEQVHHEIKHVKYVLPSCKPQ